jgi:hypothetical protein
MHPVYRTRKKQVSVAPGHHLAFAAGHGYYDAPGAPIHPPVSASQDPYDPIIAGLPSPLTPKQIQTQAQGQISPLVASITQNIGKQTAAATNAIRGYTSDAAAKLGAINYTAPYTQGEQGQAAVDSALRNALSGAGTIDADQLSQRLAVINDPAVAAAATAVADNGAANGNTQLAQGSAALGNLIANAAAAGSYGQKQPGITRLAGLQNIAATQQQGVNNIASQTQQLEAQLPAIIEALTGRNDQRASAIASARQNQVARQDAISSTGAKNAAAVKAAQTKAAATVKVATIKANEKAAADAKPNAGLSGKVGYLVDSSGNWIPGGDGKPQVLPGYKVQNGRVVKIVSGGKGPGKGGAKTPTAAQINTLVQQWHDGTPTYKTVSKNDGNGTTVSKKVQTGSTGGLTFEQAYKRLTSMGLDDAGARKYLQGYYKRGDNGRGWLTNEEQAALRKAGVTPRAYKNSGVGFLRPDQAKALKAAGMLPPGHWIQGRTDTQDLGPVYIIEG